MDVKVRNKFIEILNIVSLIGLTYFLQIIGGYEFWKYESIDEVTGKSLNILGQSIKSIPL